MVTLDGSRFVGNVKNEVDGSETTWSDNCGTISPKISNTYTRKPGTVMPQMQGPILYIFL